ncbi:hypothetical protein C2G38_2200979 [Gigaspora rosea]|uniref:Uncharacterized protein n=1 Tax=Gigaspora rosea TaxID=44941 RepID=A0A397USU0_9GLOM|nr:hypothetical protein C2G38_2200979 [Gigaspora rosea]
MESKRIVAKTHIDTCPVELKNVFGTFVNDHIDNTFAEVYMNNNIMESEHAFKNHVVNDILEPGRTFATFAKACATIKRYTAQTKAALFACK